MSSSKSILYKVENLTKTFITERGKVNGLLNASFDVKEGEITVIIGPSGCGKSTLLRIFAHLIEPTKGKIIFQGKNNSKPKNSKFGYIFQRSTLMPWRTIIDNVVLPLEINGEKKEIMNEKAIKLLRLLNLEKFQKHYPIDLSGGMRQRTAIARALISDPPVLLMDEPFSALDEIMRQKLDFELLNIKRKTNKTIIFVTHSILEAVTLADKIIILGLNPNTVIGEKLINFPKRTLDLLTDQVFFKNVAETRKILEKGLIFSSGETNGVIK
jgi:NitT/TauT family transport system ATP-binding protein